MGTTRKKVVERLGRVGLFGGFVWIRVVSDVSYTKTINSWINNLHTHIKIFPLTPISTPLIVLINLYI